MRGCELEGESIKAQKIKAQSSKLKGQKNRNQKMKFGYEDLDVWNWAVDFAVKAIKLIETIDTGRKRYRLFEQIEASSTSVSMNLAEGKDRFSQKEFIHFGFLSASIIRASTL